MDYYEIYFDGACYSIPYNEEVVEFIKEHASHPNANRTIVMLYGEDITSDFINK